MCYYVFQSTVYIAGIFELFHLWTILNQCGYSKFYNQVSTGPECIKLSCVKK